MSRIFTRIFRVRWGELDASGTVSPVIGMILADGSPVAECIVDWELVDR